MDASVRYAQSTDGTSIAYSTAGSGPPLVYLQPFSHQQLDASVPMLRDWYGRFSANRTLIRYDIRQFGLSQRGGPPNTADTFMADLEAVVDAAGLEQFDLLGVSGLGLVAMLYAAKHQERVQHLVLWGTDLSGRELNASGRGRMIRLAGEVDPNLALELLVRAMFGEDSFANPQLVDYTRAALTVRDAVDYMSAGGELDLTDLAASIRAPTLLMQPHQDGFATVAAMQRIASRIEDCEIAYCTGATYPHTGDGADERARLISDFLGGTRGEPGVITGFQTILFTDLEASTPLTQRLGDEGAQEILRGHNKVVREALDEHGGREVKRTGDGIMASFPSAVSAVTAALQIQRGLAGGEVRVRVGLNAGEPIVDDDDLFGLSVIKAARIADRAEPGTVLVSDVVKQLCEGKTFEFASLGPVSLKGFDEAVTLFEVVA